MMKIVGIPRSLTNLSIVTLLSGCFAIIHAIRTCTYFLLIVCLFNLLIMYKYMDIF